MTEKHVLADVVVEEVDSLIYGEIAALYNSAEALNVDGPYVFIVYDGSLYLCEYDSDELKIYRIYSASKIDIDAVKIALEIFGDR